MKFELTKHQVSQFEEWSKDHNPLPNGRFNATLYKFSFIPVSFLGTSIIIENMVTKEVLELTDYN